MTARYRVTRNCRVLRDIAGWSKNRGAQKTKSRADFVLTVNHRSSTDATTRTIHGGIEPTATRACVASCVNIRNRNGRGRKIAADFCAASSGRYRASPSRKISDQNLPDYPPGKVTIMSEDQRRALDEALESLAPRLSPADGPLVALLRMLADELDQGGTPAALASTYLTSLRTLYKHAGGGPRETPGATLRALRSKHGKAAS